jgi:hypothetical protein
MHPLRLAEVFRLCSHADMTRLTPPAPPVLDSQLAHSIADWVTRVPDHLLVELAIGDRRAQAAEMISELIVAEMTMHYPELVESGAPPLPF